MFLPTTCNPSPSHTNRVREVIVWKIRRYSYRDHPIGCSLLLYYLRRLFSIWFYLVDQISDILITRIGYNLFPYQANLHSWIEKKNILVNMFKSIIETSILNFMGPVMKMSQYHSLKYFKSRNIIAHIHK